MNPTITERCYQHPDLKTFLAPARFIGGGLVRYDTYIKFPEDPASGVLVQTVNTAHETTYQVSGVIFKDDGSAIKGDVLQTFVYSGDVDAYIDGFFGKKEDLSKVYDLMDLIHDLQLAPF